MGVGNLKVRWSWIFTLMIKDVSVVNRVTIEGLGEWSKIGF